MNSGESIPVAASVTAPPAEEEGEEEEGEKEWSKLA